MLQLFVTVWFYVTVVIVLQYTNTSDIYVYLDIRRAHRYPMNRARKVTQSLPNPLVEWCVYARPVSTVILLNDIGLRSELLISPGIHDNDPPP